MNLSGDNMSHLFQVSKKKKKGVFNKLATERNFKLSSAVANAKL